MYTKDIPDYSYKPIKNLRTRLLGETDYAGTQTLAMIETAPTHKANLLDRIDRDLQTLDRQGLYYTPHEQEAITEEMS